MIFRNMGKFMVGIFLLSIAACKSNNAGDTKVEEKAVSVTLDTVKTENAIYYNEYPGTVTALKDVTLISQVSGYVTGVYFKDGQKISRGQKLYSIDAQVYDANYQNALAQVDVQEANLVKAQKDADRYHLLDKQDAIAKQQVDYADAALTTAQKQVAAAKASVNAVRASVRFSTIYAPFDGTIGISNVRVGTAVVAGQTILNSVSTNNPMAVDFNVDQSELYRFEKLQQSGKENKVFSIAFGSDIYPENGTIALIDRAVDPQTGTIKIRLSFDNQKNLLKPGMTTIVRVLNTSGNNALIIPHKSITEQLGEFFVYVVNDSNKVSQQHVVLGQNLGENVIVTSGLQTGQKIVIEGQQNLHEGAKVTTDKTSAIK